MSHELRLHLDRCPKCRQRLEQNKAEVALLREGAPEAALSPSTASEPTSDLASGNCHPERPDAALPFKLAETTESRSSTSETDLGFTTEAGDAAEPPIPAAIGRYLVIGRFPRTGQAEVFRVVHPGLAKDLVLKLALKPMEPGGRHEIIEECKISAELEHPNLVRVYDLDFHDERPYLVMEYIRGRTLEQVAAEGYLTPRQAAVLLAKVAAAVDFAHRHGIVHRDIKPKNILVDEAGEPRLIDFGMARLRHAWSDDPGRPGGTFAFMAPEQARIESPQEQQKVGPCSDVFALGAVLYFLLTGKAPFPGENWRESMGRARRCDFDRKALDDSKVPRELKRICLQAMAADPADRIASAGTLQKALERFLRQPIIQAAAATALGLGLLCGILYEVLSRSTPPPAPPLGPQYVILPAAGGASIAQAAQPMKGRIDLLVVKSKDGKRRRLRLEDRGSVPVRAGDEIRIEARLDSPAYLYLFWIGSEGKVAPLYPWKDHDWSTRPADERKVTEVELPEIVDDIQTIPRSTPGLETLVLLAREESPLRREDADKLAQGLAGSPVPMPAGMNEAIWLEDGQEVVFGAAHRTTKAERGAEDLSRGIPSPKTRKSDDPVLRVRALLSDKLQTIGSYNQAVVFPNEGN
jgi:hypothetical protein